MEWKLDAYSNSQGDNNFVIITDHKTQSVERGTWAAKQISKNKDVTLGEKVVDIHSHPGIESKGASNKRILQLKEYIHRSSYPVHRRSLQNRCNRYPPCQTRHRARHYSSDSLLPRILQNPVL